MDNRLNYIAELSKGYKRIIDIGTDHGYLPVFLVENGSADFAIVSDISKASLKKAEDLIKKKNLSGKMESRVGNGLDVLKDQDNIELVIVAGMGGNLISEIINEKKEYIKKNGIALILQPMQNAEVLRKYLIDNDFSFKSHLVEDEKIYQIIEVNFKNNEAVDYSNLDLELGKKSDYKNKEDELKLYEKMVSFKIKQIEKIIINVKKSSTKDKDDIIKSNEEQLFLLNKYLEN